MTPDFKIDGEFGALTEIYSSDGTELLSRTKLGSNNLTKGLYTTTKYSKSKPVTESTDLKNIGKIDEKKILGLMTPEVITDKNTREKAITKDNQTFTSKELKN